MDKKDLREILIKENFKPSAYSLNDAIKDEALCLRKDDRGWYVFYSERGLQTAKQYFESESDACEFFVDEMRDDPTTKENWKSGFNM
ncbi:MAG: hypothetical protein KBT87_06300 [Gammaproteobacteria bacterium]|nr:hypothetical protein [Gammaproteobacteria bacterium]MBQ0774266.1 hypothetical protein [Gammaproteobacteria bacterium]